MKKKMGAIISIALTLALVLSLATTALAGSDNGGKGNKAMGSQFSASDGGSADKSKKTVVSGFDANTKHAGNPSLANGAPEEAIAALSDAEKLILKDYIKAYEDAVAEAIAAMENAQKGDDLSEYRESVMTALKNLLKAAKEAGIVLKTSMSSAASINGQLHRNWSGKDFIVTVEEAIAALSDEDKDTLSDEIDAYENAVDAAAEAKETADEGDDLSAYREAVMSALKDLLDAAEEADIDLGLKEFPAREVKNGLGGRIGSYFTEAVEETIAALSDEDKDTLSGEIDTYEDAVAAAVEAKEDADEDDDLSAYREAVVAALRDLLDAAKEADIDLGLMKVCGR